MSKEICNVCENDTQVNEYGYADFICLVCDGCISSGIKLSEKYEVEVKKRNLAFAEMNYPKQKES